MVKKRKKTIGNIESSNKKIWLAISVAFIGGLLFVFKDNISNQIGDLALDNKDPYNKVFSVSDAPFWYRFSASNGNVYAQHKLSEILIDKNNSQELKNEGVKWLTISAESGNPIAQYKLGKILSDGIIAPGSREKGLSLLIQSSKSPAVVKEFPNIYSSIAKQFYLLELDTDPNTVASKEDLLKTIEWAEKGVANNEVESAEFLTDIYLTNKLNIPEVEALKKAGEFNQKAISLGSHTNGLMVLINLKLYQLTKDPLYANEYNKYFPAAYIDPSDTSRGKLISAPIIGK